MNERLSGYDSSRAVLDDERVWTVRHRAALREMARQKNALLALKDRPREKREVAS